MNIWDSCEAFITECWGRFEVIFFNVIKIKMIPFLLYNIILDQECMLISKSSKNVSTISYCQKDRKFTSQFKKFFFRKTFQDKRF